MVIPWDALFVTSFSFAPSNLVHTDDSPIQPGANTTINIMNTLTHQRNSILLFKVVDVSPNVQGSGTTTDRNSP
jgi:hypothetical protein